MLKIQYIEFDIFWEQPQKNRQFLEEKIKEIPDEIDLIVLPEMFTTGFTWNTTFAESMQGDTVKWLQKIAGFKKVAIAGSISIKEKDKFYNRLLFVFPSGEIQYYDKRHLFSLSEERNIYQRGETLLEVSYKGWKIRPMICYDLRFPVWSRNTTQYDVLLYVANWPQSREMHWKTLLRARAIENQCYVIGVNRVGEDGNQWAYSGKSVVYDAFGKRIDDNQKALLSKKDLQQIRTRYPFLEDRD